MALARTGTATTFITPSDDDMIVGARAIVRGKVLSMDSTYDSDQNKVYTYVKFKVQEVIKGQIAERKIVIKLLGGQAGEYGTTVYGNPEFKVGERAIVYLDTWPDGSLKVHHMFLGKYTITRDESTGRDMAARTPADANVIKLQIKSRDNAPSKTITERMELSSFIALLRDRLSRNWEHSMAFEREHYSHIPMRAVPGEYRDKVREGRITPQYTFISNPPRRWFEPDTGLPVIAKVKLDGAPLPSTLQDMEAAMGAWTGVPGCSLQVQSGGAITNCYTGLAGIGIVFDNCDGYNSASPSCSGTLAWGGFSLVSSSTRIINGTTFGRVTQGFVSFNPWANCFFTTGCRIREIATHEVGHALGLGHSQDGTATMAPTAHFDNRCASIRTDDQNGIRFMYPATGGPLTITTAILPNASNGSAYSAQITAIGGTSPYTWQVTAGNLPPGLSIAATSATTAGITGTPTTDGNYTFTVQARDSAAATTTKEFTISVGQVSSQYNSQLVSQTVPTPLTPGQTFNSNFKWLNTGSLPWDGANGFKLVSQNPAFNTTWGGDQVVPTIFFINPGQTMDITFSAIAPLASGTYNFQWQTFQTGVGFFGQPSNNVAIQVGSGGGGGGTNNAEFVSQSVPTTMTAGQSVSVSVTMRNSGTTTWEPGPYKLVSENPANNSTWGLSQVAITSAVPPGSQKTFTFNATAPATAGTYNFQWRMIEDSTGWFGATTPNVAVSVTGGTGGTEDSAFVSQSVPTSMGSGESVRVSVRMRNAGTTTWAPGPYKLGSQNPGDNMNWGMNRVTLSTSIPPGGSAIFTFDVTAPTNGGTYNFQWRMFKEGMGFFGGMSTNIPVVVNGTPPAVRATTTGVFRPSNGSIFLKNTNATGFADILLTYGLPGDYAIAGDWDGDGVDTIGVYRNGSFFLRNSNTNGIADLVFAFGSPGDQPVVGDWNNDGIDTIGIYRNGTFMLRNSNTTGPPDMVFELGIPGDVGIAGDWNGDGVVTTGVFRPSNGALYLKNSNSTGFADLVLTYGIPGDKPVVGDWNGDGVDTIGVYRNGTFHLRNSNTNGFAELVFSLGVEGDHPIAGVWTANP